MTLVLSVSTPAYSLQVSDRLVSRRGVPHDPLANKSVVFRATDGLLVLGYTGPAFIGDLPTDTWIADVVSGGSCIGASGGMQMGEFAVRDVGSSLRVLCRRLRVDRQFCSHGGELSAAGWQWSARRDRALVRNVLWMLHGVSGELQWQQLVPRHLPDRKRVFRMVAIGNWALPAEDWRGLLGRVGDAGRDWGRVEGLLVDAIRRASALQSGTIGSHCVSVLLRPWLFPNALVHFRPSTPHHGTAFAQAVEVAYSPWMVAPDALHAPAVIVGGLSSEQGLLTYTMDAPRVPVGQILKGAFQSQERPSPS
jgi:hypothetical protein